MKVCLVAPIYQRPELTRLCMEYYRTTFPDITIINIESPKDPQIHLPGVYYFSYPNDNLAQKFNECFLRAREFSPDAVILTGSNDILSGEYIDLCKSFVDSDKVFGLKDFYLYERQDKKAIHWHGMKQAEQYLPIGAGRLFSKNVLNKIDWKPYGNINLPRGLDTNSSMYLISKGINHTVDTMGSKVHGIGIKDKLLSTLNKFEEWLLNGEYVSNQILYDAFPEFFEKLHAGNAQMERFTSGAMMKCKIISPEIGDVGSEQMFEGMVAYGLFRNGLIELVNE